MVAILAMIEAPSPSFQQNTPGVIKRRPIWVLALAFVAIAVAVCTFLHHRAYTLAGSYTAHFPPVDSFAAGSSAHLSLHADGTAELVSRAPSGERSVAAANWSLRDDNLLLSIAPNPVSLQAYLMQVGTHVYRRAPSELTAVGIESDGQLFLYGSHTYPQPVSFTFRRDLW